MGEGYRKDGVEVYTSFLENESYTAVEQLLADLTSESIERARKSEAKSTSLDRFEGESDPNVLLHDGLIELAKVSQPMIQYIVDAFMHSREFYHFLSDERITQQAAELIGCEPLHVNINTPHYRLDLPAPIFKANVSKMHLPLHQESSYFREDVSPGTGLVVWIPLFDCGPKEGSLTFLKGSHTKGLLEHEECYMDLVKRRHRRLEIPDSVATEYEFVEVHTRRGDVAFQHFDAVHRSGVNSREDYVRHTLIVRMSNLLAEDFYPHSWS